MAPFACGQPPEPRHMKCSYQTKTPIQIFLPNTASMKMASQLNWTFAGFSVQSQILLQVSPFHSAEALHLPSLKNPAVCFSRKWRSNAGQHWPADTEAVKEISEIFHPASPRKETWWWWWLPLVCCRRVRKLEMCLSPAAIRRSALLPSEHTQCWLSWTLSKHRLSFSFPRTHSHMTSSWTFCVCLVLFHVAWLCFFASIVISTATRLRVLTVNTNVGRNKPSIRLFFWKH